MGSQSDEDGDVGGQRFSGRKLLKVDVNDPANMSSSVLVANTGSTPNGVTLKDGVATVVNWGSNADILQVDVATGAMTTLIDGTGLGNCDGVDWAETVRGVLGHPTGSPCSFLKQTSPASGPRKH